MWHWRSGLRSWWAGGGGQAGAGVAEEVEWVRISVSARAGNSNVAPEFPARSVMCARNSEHRLSSEEIARAKKVAAGPLGQTVGRYPMQFAAPLALTSVEPGKRENVLSNGTGMLVDFGGGPLIITADHVIRRFLERAREGARCLRVGNLNLYKWADRVIDYSRDLDLATIRLREIEIPMINPFSDIDIAKVVYKPRKWPPTDAKVGDWVVIGGFPGTLRLWQRPNDYSFGSFNGGPLPISEISSGGVIVCGLDREYWAVQGEIGPDFNNFGGVSGGPVFLYKDKQLDPFELVGLISEDSSFDAILARPLKFIQPTGVIVPDLVTQT